MLNFLCESNSSASLLRVRQKSKSWLLEIMENERNRLIIKIIPPKMENFLYDLRGTVENETISSQMFEIIQ